MNLLHTGKYEPGKRNSLSDVAGVTVGHCRIIEGKGALIPGKGPIRTGVTAIIPHQGNLYLEKLCAASFVANGYSKPIGLCQVDELGVLETPIVLTNTLSVGTGANAVIEYMLEHNADIGVSTGSVNPVVLECNDSYLNDIRGNHVKKEHVLEAIETAGKDFEQGAVGAGTGMSCFEFKGGIGSSSRVVPIKGKETAVNLEITVGALVLSNFGRREDLTISGVPVGSTLKSTPQEEQLDRGSIIMVVATDAPLTPRQLARVAPRAVVGLARTGGGVHHGSGDIVVAFSTAQKIPHYPEEVLQITVLPDNWLSPLFQGTAEAVEEAILTSLLRSETMEGRDSRIRYKIPEEELKKIMEKYNRPI